MMTTAAAPITNRHNYRNTTCYAKGRQPRQEKPSLTNTVGYATSWSRVLVNRAVFWGKVEFVAVIPVVSV